MKDKTKKLNALEYQTLETKSDLIKANPESETKSYGYISGYASIFGNVDSHGDVVTKGAFAKSIASLQATQEMPKMLWQHDPLQPIGRWTKIEEDHRGLYVEGQILLDLQKGKEAYELVKNQAINGLSIGYEVQESERGDLPGERRLTNVSLHEISLVTFAANEEAKIQLVKSSEKTLEDRMQRVIDLITEDL